MSESTQQRGRIARSLADLQAAYRQQPLIYDVVIVGSGYGGSVAAHALAGKGLKVCVLERGREFLPEDFPATFGELPRELRVARQDSGEVSGHEGLFDLRLGEDVNALVANGLGGGSLINAGVMLEPRAADFADGKAPAGWSALLSRLVGSGCYSAARRLLGAEVQRKGQWFENSIARLPVPLKKTEALQRLAMDGGLPMSTPPITVALEAQRNSAGTPLQACKQCGDCMTGCRVGAKDSLDTNLLAAAAHLGCEIYTGATVVSISRRDDRPAHWQADDDEAEPLLGAAGPQGHWRLRVAPTDRHLQSREDRPFILRAHKLILAAGALGSPEILLRSAQAGKLAFSPRLGEGFSCNGDNIAAARALPADARGAADEDLLPEQRDVGPTITGAVQLRGDRRDFLLQEFAVPGPMKRLFDEIVTTAGTLRQLADGDKTGHDPLQPDPLAVDPAQMARTLLLGMIGHDAADGRLSIDATTGNEHRTRQMGSLRVHWPQARTGRELDRAHEAVRRLVEGETPAAGGPSLVPNPMWRILPKALEDLVSQPTGPVLTVHPLGGCGIALDGPGGVQAGVQTGVVDEHGAVFDAAPDPADLWQGSLLVLDASIVPVSLGVNPALTISALALHAMRHWCAAWTQAGAAGSAAVSADASPAGPEPARPGEDARVAPPPSAPHPAPRVRRTEVEVLERLWGHADIQGYAHGAIIELTLAYQPASVASLIAKARQPINVDPQRSRLRLYDAQTWKMQHLLVASDTERAPHIQFEAALTGTLRFLHRDKSGPWGRVLRGLAAWVYNRGSRDVYEQIFEKHQWSPGSLTGLPKLASRAGEVRLFDYRLGLVEPTIDARGLQADIMASPRIEGSKRLTYACRSNPWTQLTTLTLDSFPGLRTGAGPDTGTPTTLTLDTRFLAAEGLPLLRITHQRNHAEALAELLSLGLYFARVVLSTHLWTFRKPDDAPLRVIDRLPGVIAGLPDPVVTELEVGHWPGPVATRVPGKVVPLHARLTRYPGKKPNSPPLLMIHGYSVSGNTFTHPTLKPSAAVFFWQRSRDVWVLDMRTSAGLDSATHPWAMEEPALIDIPMALLHVQEVTGQRVDVLAHCIGCAMLSMALLTDAQLVLNGEIALGTDTWLTAEQLATLNRFNGPGPAGGPHPVVRRVVLSQKGPVLRYTDDNILRAFVLQYVRRWLLQGDFQFRPSADPKVAEQLLDRLLASLPYPDSEFDVEHPHRPCAKTAWTATRHRMDALYGRDFNAVNMAPEVLDAIDDLFGPINLDTVAQTIHFARFDAITNQSGRGEFVTRGRLKARWRGIPTLALHGAQNGLVDVHTQVLLEGLLKDAAGVPFKALTYPDMGHQDLLIGRGSEAVFRDIEAFLADDDPGKPQPAGPADSAPDSAPGPGGEETPRCVLAAPWIGPRICPAGSPTDSPEDSPQDALRLGAIARPDQGQARLWLLPVLQFAETMGRAARYTLLDPAACPDGTDCLAVPAIQAVPGESGASGRWLFVQPELALLAGVALPAGAQAGYLVVFVYAPDETTVSGSPFEHDTGGGVGSGGGGGPGDTHFPPPRVERRTRMAAQADDTAQAYVLPEAARWLARSTPATLASCFVRLDDLHTAQALPAAAALNFALASCQYPNGLLDREVAGASLAALADEAVDFALLVGDQIYADASAGLVDPTRRDELYDQPHERALQLPAMRTLLRRMPVQMLLDDHELSDNWEPQPQQSHGGKDGEAARRKLARVRSNGLKAYLRYQRMQEPPLPGPGGRLPPADYSFTWSGHPFYMLDSRTARQRGRAADEMSDWHIVSAEQRARLERWLLTHRKEVKFIATPSLLLPRRRETAASLHQSLRSDAWDGYPASLSWLLRLICEERIRHTVFLSGDEHHSLSSEIWLGPPGGTAAERVKLVSVHSSALYAPFPFANGRPQELKGTESIPASVYGVHCEVRTAFAAPGDGYACIRRDDRAGVAGLRVSFNKAGGGAARRLHLDLA